MAKLTKEERQQLNSYLDEIDRRILGLNQALKHKAFTGDVAAAVESARRAVAAGNFRIKDWLDLSEGLQLLQWKFFRRSAALIESAAKIYRDRRQKADNRKTDSLVVRYVLHIAGHFKNPKADRIREDLWKLYFNDKIFPSAKLLNKAPSRRTINRILRDSGPSVRVTISTQPMTWTTFNSLYTAQWGASLAMANAPHIFKPQTVTQKTAK